MSYRPASLLFSCYLSSGHSTNSMWIKNPTDATVYSYLFTAKLLYMFRVSQHPSSGVSKTVPAAYGTGHTTCTATPLLRGLVWTWIMMYGTTSLKTIVRIVLIFNFTSCTASSGQFSSCTIFCSAFARSVFFLQCSNSVFHKQSRFFIKSSNNGVWPSYRFKTVCCFQTEQQNKKPVTRPEAPVVHNGGTCRDTFVAHLGWFIQSEPKLALAIFFHPSLGMITFDEWTVYNSRL